MGSSAPWSNIFPPHAPCGMAVLVDPDQSDASHLAQLQLNSDSLRCLLVGGSLMTRDGLDDCLDNLDQFSQKPKILFPGSTLQISDRADGLLFLSLISGRNADLLIGRHVEAAPLIQAIQLPTLSCGYMLIGNGHTTTAQYISQTAPIPPDKPEVAAATALAGEMLGLNSFYLDAGSGARHPVHPEMIQAVKEKITGPLIVGGGIRNPESLLRAAAAGADLVVVGNALESDPGRLTEMLDALDSVQKPSL